MQNLQRIGGLAALYAGVAYIVGMLGFLLVVGWSEDPTRQVAILADNQLVQHTLYLIVYQVWAIFLVVLTLALYERFRAGAPAVMRLATAIGIIWATLVIASGMIFNIGMDTVVDLYARDPARATTVWSAIVAVCDGIGGGNELVGGLWVLLTSWAALLVRGLPRGLTYLGLATGATGVLSALPGLGDAGLVFGLVQIAWFIWLGLVMLRSPSENRERTVEMTYQKTDDTIRYRSGNVGAP
jgi:hypothetical protein